jgi:hypothetical protein
MSNRIGITFWDEVTAAGLMGLPFSVDITTGNVSRNKDGMTNDEYTKLLSVIAAHDPLKIHVEIPDNPTLGDWRVGLALWVRDDNNDHPITWLDYLTAVVKQLVDSGHPLGKVIVQRLEYSNNVKRLELLQLKEFFQFSEDQVNESLRRAYIVSLGDLNVYATIPSKYL